MLDLFLKHILHDHLNANGEVTNVYVTTYLVVLNFAILPSLQQFNKVLAYEVRMLMTDKLQLEDGTQ
ncbi:hypothetical protein MJL79_31125, partial [Salmonella enterica subsp. enterica serovar Montevideo]|nr:hypothetical protein [Salmonella enterica subsp. enterica serovar Montevideo]